MRRFLAIVATMLCVLGTAWAQDGDGGPFAHVGQGEKVPSFVVTTTSGQSISSDQLEGRVTLITLWASWCPSCRKEFKRLAANDQFGALLEEENFLFLPISREESSATVVAWLNQKGYPYESALDPDRAVYNLFASEEIPRNIVVGPDGTILYHGSGGSKRELNQVINLCRVKIEELNNK